MIEIPKYTVIKDTREKEGKGWTFSADDYCLGTLQEKLPSGDYSIQGYTDQFVVERKATTAELCTNIYEKRWEKELDRLDQIVHSFLIFEFSYQNICEFPVNSTIPSRLWYKVKMSSDFMQKCISKWSINHKCKIFFAEKNGQALCKNLIHYFMKYGRLDLK